MRWVNTIWAGASFVDNLNDIIYSMIRINTKLMDRQMWTGIVIVNQFNDVICSTTRVDTKTATRQVKVKMFGNFVKSNSDPIQNCRHQGNKNRVINFTSKIIYNPFYKFRSYSCRTIFNHIVDLTRKTSSVWFLTKIVFVSHNGWNVHTCFINNVF